MLVTIYPSTSFTIRPLGACFIDYRSILFTPFAATSQQYFSLTPKQHQPPVTIQLTVFFSYNKSVPATNYSQPNIRGKSVTEKSRTGSAGSRTKAFWREIRDLDSAKQPISSNQIDIQAFKKAANFFLRKSSSLIQRQLVNDLTCGTQIIPRSQLSSSFWDKTRQAEAQRLPDNIIGVACTVVFSW